MPVVVVESPAKAKTIEKFLGNGYRVLASFGHVRDLAERNGSVDTGNRFGMKWEIPASSQKHLNAIAEAVARDGSLILATDPDREGEAISWHISEILSRKRGDRALKEHKRVIFNAITKSAVLSAMANPRDIDMKLVEAYLARRALDYLVGYTLSPVVMRKLPGARSAGRVQSVCLRLIVEREVEIERFEPREFWTIDVQLTTPNHETFKARLIRIGDRKLDKFAIGTNAEADTAMAEIAACRFSVAKMSVKPQMQSPYPPFMTSTLQQDASRKLGFSPRSTMSIAQKLYESGYITYMRTDGIDMAPEAIAEARKLIGQRFGSDYLPKEQRVYKNKAKNAQEAHECIRPTSFANSPESMPGIGAEQRKLYTLIWKRSLASQMSSAKFSQTQVEIAGENDRSGVGLRAIGRVRIFDGFLRVYEESRDNAPSDDEQDETTSLPDMQVKDGLVQGNIEPKQHFTKPPPRYSEASLVKKMVDLGIGRPSTYSSLVATIQDRGYVGKEKSRLFPLAIGRVVTFFLQRHFSRYVEYDFTADLEEDLDDITNGKKSRLDVLEGFWGDFHRFAEAAIALRNADVFEEISDDLASFCFPDREDGTDPRSCPKCDNGRLYARTAKGGNAFVGCSNYPDCRYTRNIDSESSEVTEHEAPLGHDPDTGAPIVLRNGRFGPYIEIDAPREAGTKPKRASVPKGMDPKTLTQEQAVTLLSMPRDLGPHPEDGEQVSAGIGRYGPYIKHGRVYAKLALEEDAFTIGMNRAVELLANRSLTNRATLKNLGEHPQGGGAVEVLSGRYGPYVSWNKVNASLPNGVDAESITIAQAVELLAAKKSGKASNNGKELGQHPKKGGMINLLSGRYGPYVKWGRINASLPAETDPNSIDLESAAKLIDAKSRN